MRLTDRPDMTLDVYRGCKTTTKTTNTGEQEQFDQALLCLVLVRLLKHILKYYKVDPENWLTCAKIGADMHKPLELLVCVCICSQVVVMQEQVIVSQNCGENAFFFCFFYKYHNTYRNFKILTVSRKF